MAPKLRVRDIAFAERPAHFRHPFRFGAVTITQASQLFVRAEIEVEGHGRGVGMTAELLAPKWFDKNPDLTPAETVDELRRALDIARELYLGGTGFDTAFGLHARNIADQYERSARERMPPLAAAFGPAEIDKAIVDALLRALGIDVFTAFKQNLVGLDARLTPDLTDSDVAQFLAAREPFRTVAVRHTVGLLDDLDALRQEARETGCRYFKLKLGGDPDADAARLAAIAEVLHGLGVDYRATVDANEQYADRTALAALVNRLQTDTALRELAARLLYIEQPLPRELTFETPLGPLGERFAFIIDEADASYDAFPKARALGYRGVSSKACKGLYKSLLNGARAARWTALGAHAFVSAEDLTCQAGLALQQDCALVSFLGIPHAERNGHHYVEGFAGASPQEAQAFRAAHPYLYEESDHGARVAVRHGTLALSSLTVPGFASAVLPAIKATPLISAKEPTP
jgi:hypothetical protein